MYIIISECGVTSHVSREGARVAEVLAEKIVFFGAF